MYNIMVEDTFSSAHHLRNYEGKCENLHGHNWKVQVVVSGEKLDDEGLLIDFTILKVILKKITDQLDHKDLNGLEHFSGINPTSENIATYIHAQMDKELAGYPVALKSITLWENEKQCASYVPSKKEAT